MLATSVWLRFPIGVVLFVLASIASPQALQSAQETTASTVLEDPEVQGAQRLFTAWMEGQLLSRDLPGVVVGVVADQELVWARGFGMADRANGLEMTPRTRFRMASHSKLFTATAILQLREQGRLSLSDPVSRHLPWFTLESADPGDPEITIEDLLTHSSGLPREADAHWSTLDFPTADEVRALVPQRQAAFPPETRWKYSNLAYTIAGEVVEAVSGESWADYVANHIFEPLGMTATSVDVEDPGLAVGYGRRMPDGSREAFPFVDSRGMAAATGMSSTVEDMARFVSAQFGASPHGTNARILSDATLRSMHRVRMMEEDWSQGSGIGFAVTRTGGRVHVGHGGGYPGYTTYTLIDLERKTGVIALTNAGDGGPAGIATQLMSSVGEAVARVTQAEPERVAWDPSWSRFAGLYRGRGSDQHVVELHERLVIINPASPTLDNRVELEPLGDGRFRYSAPRGGAPVGEVVRFVEEDGRVVRMITGDSYVDRVPD